VDMGEGVDDRHLPDRPCDQERRLDEAEAAPGEEARPQPERDDERRMAEEKLLGPRPDDERLFEEPAQGLFDRRDREPLVAAAEDVDGEGSEEPDDDQGLPDQDRPPPPRRSAGG